ncbi:MAG: hypothetical protein ACW98F_13715 [Candidatus Hodarchaeales archaeon]|jgi:hypothetical protein
MKEVNSVKLEVNGKSIGIKQFVQDFIGQSVFGMVSSLRVKGMEIQEISLKIEYGEKE